MEGIIYWSEIVDISLDNNQKKSPRKTSDELINFFTLFTIVLYKYQMEINKVMVGSANLVPF